MMVPGGSDALNAQVRCFSIEFVKASAENGLEIYKWAGETNASMLIATKM